MAAAPPITGIAEVVLNVQDLPAMREFYVGVLGFNLHSELSLETEDPDPAGKPTITFLTICPGNTPLARGGHPPMLVLIDYRRHVYAKGRTEAVAARHSTLNHLAFEVAPQDFAAHERNLRAAGLELTPSAFPALKASALFFRDPEGNVIELITHDPEAQ